MDEEGSKKINKNMIIMVVAVIIIVVAVVGGALFVKGNSATDEQAVVEDPESENVTEELVYADGTYSAEGSYDYHSGSEKINVTVTLADGLIEDVEVENMAVAPTSKQIQDDFIANYKEMVVGKNIDEVELGKVSGSSLTPLGFNAAIEDIRSQAQAQ